jgi:hypothetical protein
MRKLLEEGSLGEDLRWQGREFGQAQAMKPEPQEVRA